MRYVRTIVRDILSGRFIDVYATSIAAFAVAVLNLFGLSDRLVLPVLLAAATVLLIESAATRRAIEALGQIVKDGGRPRLLTAFPEDLSSRRHVADSQLLVGVSLDRTLETSFPKFEELLRNGKRIRFLLVDPSADEAVIDSATRYAASPVHTRRKITDCLEQVDRLRRADTRNGLEVRLTRSALKYGCNMLNDGGANAYLCIQYYGYRQEGESHPILALTPVDGYWFTRYRDEVEHLWSDARVWEGGTPVAEV